MIISAPTPDVVETVLVGIRDGSSALARYLKFLFADESVAARETRLAELPWWADAIDPVNVARYCLAGGPTPEEAAAAAWVQVCVGEWFEREAGFKTITEEEYQRVPRCVPTGWSFGISWFYD